MRIMIVTDQYPPMVGGVPNVTHGLATDFAARGHQVAVVAPSYGPRDVHRVEDNVQIYRFSSFEWPTYEELRIPLLPILPFRRVLKRFDPDIIHVHSPVVLGNIAQIVAGNLRKPMIVTNHYLPINMSRSLSTDPIIGRSFKVVSYSYFVSFCNRFDYVTAPTQTALNFLYEHGLRAPAQAISNGIDLRKYTPGEPDEELRSRLGLPANLPLILSVNRLSPEKRIDVLIDAMALLKEQAHLVITGTGPEEAELRAQVEKLGLGERTSFLGFVSDADLVGLYRLAAIFAIPSEGDLQSLATMEAMACGLPVVAADAYALPELVHHAQNGFLFPRGKSAEMASYLDILLGNPALRGSMGAKSLEIIAPHDRRRILDQWEALYQRLSNEFIQARERKLQLRLARKLTSFRSIKLANKHKPRKTNKLPEVRKVQKMQKPPKPRRGRFAFDKGLFGEE
jgi:phosphatidylinositol alpha 1,6-mannosyltransferase